MALDLAASIADDCDYFDGLQEVLVTDRDGGFSQTVSTALRRAITTREIARSNGRYTSDDANWHLKVNELTQRPKLGWLSLFCGQDGKIDLAPPFHTPQQLTFTGNPCPQRA